MISLQPSTAFKDISTIQRLFHESYRLNVVATAVELKLFQHLEEEKLTKEEINTEFQLDGQFTGSFLLALVDTGLLILEDGIYQNSSISSTYLVPKKPLYQGDLFLQSQKETEKWRHLTKLLRKEAVPQQEVDNSYMNSQFQFALCEQKEIINRIKQWDGYATAKTILDVSNPVGIFAFTLCEENLNLNANIICSKKQQEYANKYIESRKLNDTVKIIDNNLKELIEGPETHKFDIVILSHTLYQYRRELLPTYEKLANLINPGGLLISNHWFCSPGCGTENQGVADLNKAVSIGGHPLCHEERYKTFITDSGFTMLADSTIPSMCGDSKFQMAIKNKWKAERSNVQEDRCCKLCD